MDKNNNFSFLVQDSNCVTNIDEECFYDTLDDKYIKDNGEININRQHLLLCYHGNSIKKLEIFDKQKTSKLFQFKNKLVNLFTCGRYNCEAKRVNKIVCENVNISNQKIELKKVGLKILQFDNRLNKIKKVKKEQVDKMDLLEHWYNVGKEMNLRNQLSTSSNNCFLDKQRVSLENINICSINSRDFFPVQHDGLSHCTIL